MRKRMFVGLVLILLLATACSGTTPAQPTKVPATVQPLPTQPPTATPFPTATPTVVPTATPTAVPTPANPLDALGKVFKGWLGVKSFRAKMVSTDAKNVATTMNLDSVMPDRFHITSDKFEAIIIGTVFYMKTNNQWLKVPMPKGVDFSFADIKKLEAELKVTRDTKFLGAEVLDGTPTLVYEYTTTIQQPVATTTTSKVWVAVSDSLPRKMETLSKTGIKTVTTYYDYNAPITIDPPIK